MDIKRRCSFQDWRIRGGNKIRLDSDGRHCFGSNDLENTIASVLFFCHFNSESI